LDYTAFDLSPHALNDARVLCKNYKVNFIESMLLEFNSDKKFDLVIGAEVLQVIPTKDIVRTVEYLLTFSRKHLIHENHNYVKDYKITKRTHGFRHNFKKIYDEINSVSLKIISIPDQPERSIYHVIKRQQNSDVTYSTL